MNEKYALLSVYNKKDILPLAQKLIENNYNIISSGGTFKKLKEDLDSNMIDKLIPVEDLTGFPEVLNGRVKTLQPQIHAGILADRNNETHKYDIKKHNIKYIDLVAVNLYPFQEVVSKDHTYEQGIENIDIGGVALIRAAAKNNRYVSVFTDPSDYHLVDESLELSTSFHKEDAGIKTRLYLAKKAFLHVSMYDIAITEWFTGDEYKYRIYEKETLLKYGCNPHQDACILKSVYPNHEYLFDILNGKIGYINVMDAVRAWELVSESSSILNNVPVATSFKHTTPAGVSKCGKLDDVILDYLNVDRLNSLSAQAVARARDCDPLSSFGDFVAVSHEVDEETAMVLKKEVTDGIIAPSYTKEALDILKTKKSGNYVILLAKQTNFSKGSEIHELSPGISLFQERNNYITSENDFDSIKTKNKNLPSNIIENLLLANTTLKYTPSNSITIAYDGRVIGVGAGQQNRVDCVRLAGRKAKTWINRRNFNTKKLIFKQGTKRQDKVNGRVLFSQNNMTSGEINNLSSILENPKMLELINEQSEIQLDNIDLSLASDAFFPFRDSIDVADSFNVKYIIQPGGSIADEGVIEACNEYNVIMCTTGKRQFLH
jgi:phosphoribosylaminoimidazolecarboxamide formyltransferase / IMP cyclohydrolase